MNPPGPMVLLRLGEACDHDCPMCPNDTRRGFHPLPELKRRVALVAAAGFRRVMLTGGEPTLHPAFFELATAIHATGQTFDLNTHAGRIDDAGARRLRALGLARAVVSLHAHQPHVSGALSGMGPAAHARVLAGIDALRAAGVEVCLNAVLARANLPLLPEMAIWLSQRFPGVPLKLAFPLAVGRGRDFAGTALTFEEVRAPVRAAADAAARVGMTLLAEGIPPCLGVPELPVGGRTIWGETHLLGEDDVLHEIAELDALTRVLGPACGACGDLHRCPGVGLDYIRTRGFPVLPA